MRATTRSDYRERVVAVVTYLAEHLDEAPDLAALAQVGGFSPFWFHRVFFSSVGETPAELSRRMRLERAAWRLRTSGQPLAEIAFDAGFRDQPAFTKAFRTAYGTPPGRFRALGMPAHEIPAPSEIHFSPPNLSPSGRPFRIRLPDSQETPMTPEFVELEPRRYASLRHLGPYPEIGATFEKAAALAAPAGLLARPGALFVGVYHDDPGTTRPEELTSDAGVTVDEGVRIPEGLAEGTLAGGRYAKGIHKGPYAGMGESWGRLMEATHASGARPRMAPPFELYIGDMETTPEDELVTELYMAVE